MFRRPAVVVMLAFVGLSACGTCRAEERAAPPLRLRRPVALAVSGSRVIAANQRTGTLSVLDASRRAIVAETPVAERLSDLAFLPGERWLLAADDARHEVLLLDAQHEPIRVQARLAVAKFPVRLLAGREGTWAAVSSLWSRRLTLVRIEPAGRDRPPRLATAAAIDLDFAPRELCEVPAGMPAPGNPRLVVADAFGGRMAVVDPAEGKIVHTLSIAGHNLRGLAVHAVPATNGMSKPSLLIAHQVLNSDTSTTHEHVFWGGVIGNRLRALEWNEVLAADRAGDRTGRRDATPGSIDVLGRPGAAAGDPGGVAVTSRGATVVALSGINEVAVRRRPEDVFSQRPVGRRPTAVAVNADGTLAFVANTLDDSISIVDLTKLAVAEAVPLGPSPPLALADRGEQLFYDSRLSLDGWYSCQSCHTDGHTNGLLNDNLGDEYFGAPKKVLSLLGTSDTSPWAWNGGAVSLEAQLGKSLRATMQSDERNVTEENLQALKAYLATLEPPPGIDAARGTLDRESSRRGEAVFRREGCADCHAPSTYTTPGTFDVGLHDERGHKEFNPPSLRGVSQRAPYFHDNRAADLNEVLTRFRHGLKHDLADDDRRDLLAFLRSL